MGATTFAIWEQQRANRLRLEGKLEEAKVAKKNSDKFKPRRDSKALDGLAKDQDAVLKPTFENSEKVEVDLDGDGKPDVVISKK